MKIIKRILILKKNLLSISMIMILTKMMVILQTLIPLKMKKN